MSDTYYFGHLVEQFEFKQNKTPAKYAWITVERNEGQVFKTQIEQMAGLRTDEIDIIVVDGASNDGSVNIEHLRSIGVKCLLKSHANVGFSRDLQIGLIYALRNGYSGVITVDGNGKDSLERIDKFIDSLNLGFDYVQGSRFIAGGGHMNTPLLRLLAIKLLAAPSAHFFSRHKITDPTNGFRGYSRKLLLNDYLGLGKNIFYGYNLVSFIPVVAGRKKLLIREIPVFRSYPRHGTVPTKIVTFKQWMQIFLDLFRSGYGKFTSFPEETMESLF
jgi:dolichol-phosphate mannosyltransferase